MDGRILLEFKAGRSVKDGKRVKSLSTKGLIQLQKRPDNKINFIWKSRENDAPEIQVYELAFNDAQFRQIGNAKSRVYLLENKVTHEKPIFWMQDKDPNKDQQIVTNVNRILSGASPPPPPVVLPRIIQDVIEPSPRPNLPAAATLNSPHTPHFSSNHPVPAQSSGLSSGLNTEFLAPGNTNLLQEILKSALTQLGVDSSGVTLSRIFSYVNEIYSALQDPKAQEQLLEYLPPTLQTHNELYETVSSPQFLAAVRAIEEIINSEHFSALVASCGLSLEGLSSRFGTTAFLEAIQKDTEKSQK